MSEQWRYGTSEHEPKGGIGFLLILSALIVAGFLTWLLGGFLIMEAQGATPPSIDPTQATANVSPVAQSPKAASSPDIQNKAMQVIAAPVGYSADVVRCKNQTGVVMTVYYALLPSGAWFNTGMRIPAKSTNDVVIMKPAGQQERFYRLQQ